MIVVIAGQPADPATAALSANLAVLRRRAGAHVLLVDAGRRQADRAWLAARAAARISPRPQVLSICGAGFGERLDQTFDHYDDVLIDAGDCAGQECRSALVAAQVALVPIAPSDADPDHGYALVARLNAARMFNPDLRVVFVAVADVDGAEGDAEAALAAVRAYAHEVMSGHVAAAVLPRAALLQSDAPGGCACDSVGCAAALQLDALGREIFGAAHARKLTWAHA
jgi:chromosome partitioning protein